MYSSLYNISFLNTESKAINYSQTSNFNLEPWPCQSKTVFSSFLLLELMVWNVFLYNELSFNFSAFCQNMMKVGFKNVQ